MVVALLNVEPDDAVLALEEAILDGYQLKDSMSAELSRLQPLATDLAPFFEPYFAKWEQQYTAWLTSVVSMLLRTYCSPVYAYNFRDVPGSALMQAGLPIRYSNVVNAITGRIQQLTSYNDFVRTHFNINFVVNTTVVGRDQYNVDGTGATIRVENKGKR